MMKFRPMSRSALAGLTFAAALAFGVVAGAPQTAIAAPAVKQYWVMVFSRPIAGKDTEFNQWYDQQHVPDMLSIPGFTAAQRFVTVQAATPTSTLPPYLVIYDVNTRDLDATNAEVMHRIKAGTIRKGKAIDYPGIVTFIYAPLGPPQLAKRLAGTKPPDRIAGHDELKTFELIVFSNPVDAQEDEYNHWYDTMHVPDVLHVPGFISGQRFKLAQNASPDTAIPRYLARFEFTSYDLDSTVADIVGRIKSGKTRMSPTMAPNNMVYFDAPLGPRVSAGPVKP